MTLSVCCPAGSPGPRVRALLEPFREIADEIVIAADSRLDETTLAEYATVADKLLRVEFAYTSRYLGWLHAQCSGDWILRIDADEIASPELVAAIPQLLKDRNVRQYLLPQRWLYPDASTWLDEPPWWPAYQLRLSRNDCFLRFSGKLLHSGAVNQPPAAYLELPLYHLNLIANSREQRQASTASYDTLWPGRSAPGGGSFNQRYYLPECASSLELSAVPEDDQRELDRVLKATAATNGVLGREIPVTSLVETDLFLEGRPFEPELFRGEIAPIEKAIRMMPGEERAIHFRVTNCGQTTWPWPNPAIDVGRQVRLSYHWLNEDGSIHDYDGLQSWLPRRLDPGDSTVVPLLVRAPKKKGAYVLEVDLVHERWLGCSVKVTVPVAARELMIEAPTQSSAHRSFRRRGL